MKNQRFASKVIKIGSKVIKTKLTSYRESVQWKVERLASKSVLEVAEHATKTQRMW